MCESLISHLSFDPDPRSGFDLVSRVTAAARNRSYRRFLPSSEPPERSDREKNLLAQGKMDRLIRRYQQRLLSFPEGCSVDANGKTLLRLRLVDLPKLARTCGLKSAIAKIVRTYASNQGQQG